MCAKWAEGGRGLPLKRRIRRRNGEIEKQLGMGESKNQPTQPTRKDRCKRIFSILIYGILTIPRLWASLFFSRVGCLRRPSIFVVLLQDFNESVFSFLLIDLKIKSLYGKIIITPERKPSISGSLKDDINPFQAIDKNVKKRIRKERKYYMATGIWYVQGFK